MNTETQPDKVDLLARLPWLRRLPTQQELKQLKFESSWNPAAATQLKLLVARLSELKDACAADDHVLFQPTHIMETGSDIIGSASIGAIPMVNLWLDSKKVKPRESAMLVNMVENTAAGMGFATICLPCWKSSPLRPFMERGGGYNYFGETGLFLKDLR
jgi:hypothetical protein